jgi:hypothetical protein
MENVPWSTCYPSAKYPGDVAAQEFLPHRLVPAGPLLALRWKHLELQVASAAASTQLVSQRRLVTFSGARPCLSAVSEIDSLMPTLQQQTRCKTIGISMSIYEGRDHMLARVHVLTVLWAQCLLFAPHSGIVVWTLGANERSKISKRNLYLQQELIATARAGFLSGPPTA